VIVNFQRVTAKVTLQVSVSADKFFKQLMIWESSGGWPDQPFPMEKVVLAPGSRNGEAPCTRWCYPDMSKLPQGLSKDEVPEYISETILEFDNTARTCLYRVDGEGPLGMRNYFAITEVDEVSANVARVTNTGRCDLPEGVPPEAIQGMLADVYRRGVIGGTAAMAGGKVL